MRFFFPKLNLHPFLSRDSISGARDSLWARQEEDTGQKRTPRSLWWQQEKLKEEKRAALKDACQRGTGREGRTEPERQEGEGVLEVAVISRDGSDRQRADYRARPLTFGEIHVTAAAGCKDWQTELVHHQGYPKTPPCCLPGTPLSLTDNPRFPQLPILNFSIVQADWICPA